MVLVWRKKLFEIESYYKSETFCTFTSPLTKKRKTTKLAPLKLVITKIASFVQLLHFHYWKKKFGTSFHIERRLNWIMAI